MSITNKLWTAIITPLNEDLSLDLESFENLLREQEKARNGIVILGSTGEGINLDLAEKKKIVEFSANLNLNVPVFVGVGGSGLPQVKEWLEYCESKNIQGYLMPTPLYSKPGVIGQYNWFKELLDSVKRPCMLYNVPSRAGTTLQRDALKKLIDHPNFWAIKEASGSVEEFKAYSELLKGKEIFSGDDSLTPLFAKHGCSGLVSVASNIWPEKTNIFLEKSLNGTLSDDDFSTWDEVSNSLFLAPNPVPAKVLLYNQKRIKNKSLKAPLTFADLSKIDEENLNSSIDKIKNWQ